MNQLNIIILRWITSELQRDMINKGEHRQWMLDCILHDLATITASANRPELLVGFLPRMANSDNEQEFKELFETITEAHREHHNGALEKLTKMLKDTRELKEEYQRQNRELRK